MTLRPTKTLLLNSLLLGLAGALGCVEVTGDDDGGPTTAGPEGATALDGGTLGKGPDGGGLVTTGSTLSGSDGAVGPSTPGTSTSGGSDGGPASNPSALPESCTGELPSPTACVLPDPAETPGTTPLELKVDTCGLVNTTMTEGDEDVFRFTATKSDPVLVELTYTTDKASELNYRIENQKEEYVASNTNSRSALTEQAWSTFVADAAFSYTVDVSGSKVGACQPYALRVNTLYCTDAHEDNDSKTAATKLAWAADQTVSVDATMFTGDDDFFEVIAPKSDPIALTGSYTVSATSVADLSWRAEGSTDNYLTSDTNARKGTTEEWSSWVTPDAAGAVVRVNVSNSGSSTQCVPYKLKLDAAGCTDTYEDNDEESSAKPVPLDQDVSATIIYGDDDYYSVTALPQAGLCTVTYTAAAGSSRNLTARLESSTGSYLTSGNTTINGETHVLTIKWADPAATLQLSAAQGSGCAPYTIKCVAQ
jgi:hypothetical protein